MTIKSKFIFFMLMFAITLLPLSLMAYKVKEVESSQGKDIPRKSKLWAKEGRIVGELKRPPGKFTIEVRRQGSNAPILTEEHYGYLTIFETAFIAPGKYVITIKAEGYIDHITKNVTVKPGNDCMLYLSFGTIAYIR